MEHNIPVNPYVGGQGKTDVVLVSSGTYNLTVADSGKKIYGLTADVEFDLPVMEAGMMFKIQVVSSGEYVKINANGTDTIRVGAGTVCAAGGYFRSNKRTAVMLIEGPSDGGAQWLVSYFRNGWSKDS